VLVRQLRRALVYLLPDPLQYSLHSLRAGGAVAVPFLSREELKRHGSWASSAVKSNTEPSLDARLSVSTKIAKSILSMHCCNVCDIYFVECIFGTFLLHHFTWNL